MPSARYSPVKVSVKENRGTVDDEDVFSSRMDLFSEATHVPSSFPTRPERFTGVSFRVVGPTFGREVEESLFGVDETWVLSSVLLFSRSQGCHCRETGHDTSCKVRDGDP